MLRLYLKGKTVELADSDSKQFRRQLPTQIFQEEMKGISGQKETGGILSKNQHNYPERIKNIIGELLVNRTGKDYSSLVRGEVEKQKPAFERQLFQSLVAAEVLGTNTKLKPKEFMWLLENEPIERWAELVRMAGEDMNAEFVQELEKRGFTSENISK